MTIYSSFFTISFSDNLKNAVHDAIHLYKHYTKIHKNHKKDLPNVDLIIPEELINSAFKNSQISYQCHLNNEGIYAGFPWFCQIWSRDELISMGNVIDLNPILARKLLLKYLLCKNDTGRLPAILPDKGLNSADGAGWLALRIQQLILAKPKIFSRREKREIVDFFEKLLYHNSKNVNSNGLIFSNSNETWMDTDFDDDGRKGYCIEIQALHLRIFDLLYMLTHDEKYKNLLLTLKKSVYDNFYLLNNKKLCDYIDINGIKSLKIRPNLFIAYYVYPEIFDKKEWEKSFDDSLKALWLTWGGLASLDKNDKGFVDEYTGENNRSYHRGDSWYFLNAMAAISMYDINKDKYSAKIEKIIYACSKDCMKQGVIGSIAEVSSAKYQNAVGCLSQAWSLALFIELVKKYYN